MRASQHDRVRLAEQIRVNCIDVVLSYLEDEQRVLSPSITDAALRAEFQQHHNNVRKLLNALEQSDPTIDPGLGLMASVAAALETYVRWEENSLFPALEQSLDHEGLSNLSELTTHMESTRLRPTQLLHSSIALEMPTGLPEAKAALSLGNQDPRS